MIGLHSFARDLVQFAVLIGYEKSMPAGVALEEVA